MKSAGSIQRTGAQSFKLVVSAGTGDDGKRIRKTKNIKVQGTTEEAQQRNAKRELALFLSEVEHGQVSVGGNMTLQKFYDYWVENYAVSNLERTTLEINKFFFTRIDAALGNKKISQIKPEHILLFLKNLSEPGVKKDGNEKRRKSSKIIVEQKLSSNSIRRHFALLSSMLSKAEKWGMLHENPCKRVSPPKLERKVPVIYDETILGKFLSLLAGESVKHQLLVQLAFIGGLRREEIFGLSWQDVNFATSTISIRRASVYIPGELITKKPKTTSSTRTISLPKSTMDLLAEHQKEQNTKSEMLDEKWIDSGRIFTTWNGAAAHPHSFAAWLNRFTEEHGLPHISPHKFRHMNATYLIANGTDIRTVAGKLGHSQTSTTVNVYAQFLQDAEKETANAMENLLNEIKKKSDLSK